MAQEALDDNEQLIAMAFAARDACRFDEAAVLFARLIEREPDNPSHHYLLGKVEHTRADFSRAIDHLSTANKLYAQSADIHVSLGMAYAELDRLAEAGEWFGSALRLDPNFPPALNNLGVLLLKIERYDEAAHWLEQLLERNPDTPAALVNLGRTRIGQQRPFESHSFFLRAIALNPESVDAYEFLGISQRDLGLHSEAEATFRAGLKSEPENANILYNLSYALFDQGGADEAFDVARHNVNVNPDSALAQMAIGHLYGILNKPQQGLPHLRQAIALNRITSAYG